MGPGSLFPLVFKKHWCLSTSSKHLTAYKEQAFEATGYMVPQWVYYVLHLRVIAFSIFLFSIEEV